MTHEKTSRKNDAFSRIRAEELAQLTSELIDIPSSTGHEEAVALYLADRFRAAGLKTTLQEVEPGRLNVVGRLEGNGTGQHLLYLGHTDTTWSGDEEGIADLGPGFKPHAIRDGDWIHGMGAYNMKSGLASMVHAVEAIAKAQPSGLNGDLIIAGVVGETVRCQVGRHQGSNFRGTGAGAMHLVNAGVTADAAVIAEPTKGLIDIATGGLMLFEVISRAAPRATYRRAGESDRIWPPDAIEKAIVISEKVSEWAPGFIARSAYKGEALGNVSFLAVEGGHPWRPSKAATFCRSYFEIDILPGVNQTDVEVEFRNMVRGITLAGEAACTEVNLVHNVAAAEAGDGGVLVKHLSDAHRAIVGREAQTVVEAWYCDSTPLTRSGIPTLVYGPGGRAFDRIDNQYSAQGEACYIPDLVEGSRVFVELAYDVCNSPRQQSSRASGTVVR